MRTFAGQGAQTPPNENPDIRMTERGRTKYVADAHNRIVYKTCPFCHTGVMKRRSCQSCGTTVPGPMKTT